MWWLHRLGRNIAENKLTPANVDCELHYLVVAPNYVVVAPGCTKLFVGCTVLVVRLLKIS
jgi:hypothetical protein